MTNGKIVWNSEQGWHDGPPATASLDSAGRLQIVLGDPEPIAPENLIVLGDPEPTTQNVSDK